MQFLGGALLFAGAIKCHVACNPWETASSLPIGAGTLPLYLQQGQSSELTHRSSSYGKGWCCLLGLSEKAQHQTVVWECATVAANPLSECMEAYTAIHSSYMSGWERLVQMDPCLSIPPAKLQPSFPPNPSSGVLSPCCPSVSATQKSLGSF